MKLSNIAALWWIRLRARRGQELLALFGIATGVALLFAALVASSSLTGSFQRTTESIVGDARFQLTARGAAFDPETLPGIWRLPGVAAATEVLEVRTEMEGPEGRRSVLMLGVLPGFERVNGTPAAQALAGNFALLGAMALPAPLAHSLGAGVEQRVAVDVNGERTPVRLASLLSEQQIGPLSASPVAITSLPYLQELSDQPNLVTRILVAPEPGREAQVERALQRIAAGRLEVRPADFEVALFRQAVEASNQALSIFSVLSALVGFLFAFSAVLLTVPARRAMIAELLLEGYGAATAVRVMLFDALVLGVAASALGVLVGDQISRHLFTTTPGFLELAFSFGTERIVTPANLAIALLGGVLASCAAVLGPTVGAIRAARGPASGATGDRGRRRIDLLSLAGLLVLAAGVAIANAGSGSASIGLAGLTLLIVAMLLLLPGLLRILLAVVDLLARPRRGAVPFIATADLRARETRIRGVAVAATGAIAIFASVALQGARLDIQRGMDRSIQEQVRIAPVWAMAPGGANLLATVPFDPPDIAPPPGIERLDGYRGSFLDIGDRRVWVLGPPASARSSLLGGQVVTGDEGSAQRRIRRGGWTAISADVAAELGVGVGDRVLLPTPVPIELRVAALTTNLCWPSGAIVLNASDYARAWGSTEVSALIATPERGTTPAAAARSLRAALGPRSGLVVQTAAERERDQRAASRDGRTRLIQITALVLLCATIAMAAAMAGLIWQRRPFLASVKAEGYSSGELWRSLVLQAALLVGAGCAIGAAVGLLGQRLLSHALTDVTGFPVIYTPAWSSALLACVAVAAAVVTIVAAVGYRAATVDPESGLD
ncbi:MAG TPA: FtsX-like permease family protein [Solirubrobacterales bacterium]|nr:FtsX-like permease family protein [Solirubrobacterales bacterium]